VSDLQALNVFFRELEVCELVEFNPERSLHLFQISDISKLTVNGAWA